MTRKEIANFVALAQLSVSYNYEAKAEFHQQGKRMLRRIAKLMGLAPGTYDIRSNLGGIAVSGEVTLHGERIYIQLSQSCCGPDMGFMYRQCDGRKDYCGKTNRWMHWTTLLDEDKSIASFLWTMNNG